MVVCGWYYDGEFEQYRLSNTVLFGSQFCFVRLAQRVHLRPLDSTPDSFTARLDYFQILLLCTK